MALDWLKSNFDAAKKRAQEEITKFKNADFMNAVIAACAKMAYADGIVDPKEKQKMMQFIQFSDELKVFKTDDVIASWSSISGKFDFDLEMGGIDALKTIGKLRSKPDAARAVVRVAIIIANSDGNFDEHEKKAAREICAELGVDPSEFGL
ncbi:tellurite resistance protein TerB [Sinorhizobium kostiense]|uniref:Tellurite resistance protein TerB n=1 Tax=Sinorhizobium kostiense TaxID=76747 RepID=A0ABS4QYU9_9HYPH|nr:tellurite resistance TerB family protein [Sinorhizobium kostiense]MBP2235331.1 tellurite resistance protein TerB [Sinorhizobium kostiense]